jgi:cytochrome c-type biogenesis protein
VTGALGFFKRHDAAIQADAGSVLVAMGVLVFTGQLFRINIAAQHALQQSDITIFNSL